ncbi:MAG: sugar ABC transporter ATP-binding protein [Spirochaetales bacterium]|nr:sugar ABC transporter ATP-binding protein [Spirochaetales bacterium]
MNTDDKILEFQGITKSFPGVKALDDINTEFRYGEVHALVGENGAGKSTLMKILSGVYTPDSGKIIYKGKETVLKNPHQAHMDGISIIFQEFSLISHMTVAENVFLNREPVNKLGFLNKREVRREVEALSEQLGIDIDVEAKVATLSVVERQLVEIMKALSVDASILIMDEPSAPLTDKELVKLFEIINSLKKKGVTVIYISHMLEEVFEIADRVTVIKDGKKMGTFQVGEMTKDDLVRHMVGRDIQDIYPPLGTPMNENLLEVKNLGLDGELHDISFDLKRGEVLGLAGMVGSGRGLLVQTLLGIIRKSDGHFILEGEETDITGIRNAIGMGYCYIPSDRKNEGIIASMNILENTTVTSLDDFLSKGFINKQAEKKAARDQIAALNTKTPSIYTDIANLSGGNQQKVLLSRALLTGPKIYVIVEPTRGIDVGAKHEIYKIIRDLTGKGNSVIMVSSELPEVIGMSDRVLVLHRGTIAGIIDQHEKPSNEEEILSLAVGHEYSLRKEGA